MAKFEQKILSPEQILEKIAAGELQRPLIFTNGVFDILHRGHVTYLEAAKALGASLVVAVNTDESVKRLGKAPDRPFNTMEDRRALLAALASTDVVTYFAEDTPYELIDKLRPDVIVKGGDYDMSKLPETALVHQWGGKAVAIDFEHDRSTTALVKKIKA
ncbi:D-glycero-beta-D-manno-heptose 1-phosphate adenylyltransferase [Pelistega suis]|uniref:D-glycero-beta-D-manno-heptose 1-phosphate adenylyltransferase n=1 Tax=Pelistega suis TaxID=1631957 RepID=A0A849P0H0_9BURK|nr:D-glycero-beta-D-manno-heptose 1-phosphate adenylyltransferase [Pelistega suis]NOL50890.1 D-glycero-beta-D-manno-heptose 1-phosphate adenylyltransferase [Pelistega suis]